MFIGQYNNNMDAKKRLTFPAKFRSLIEGQLYISIGLEKCVAVYTPEQWQELLDKLESMPGTKKAVREYRRVLLGNAAQVEFDANGRISIPQNLCNHASLTKSCVIVGVGSQIEIWDEQKWTEYNSVTEANFEEIAEQLNDFDF